MRFLGLGLEDRVPDATTVWLFRKALTKANPVRALFERFNGHLNAKGHIARGGQIVDATIVSVPRQHNAMGGKFVRAIGMAYARAKIGLMDLVYNMRRLVQSSSSGWRRHPA